MSRKRSSRVAPIIPRFAVRLRIFQSSSSMGRGRILYRRWGEKPFLLLPTGESLEGPLEHLVDEPAPVHLDEHPLLPVVGGEGLRLVLVDLDPASDGLLLVVLADDEHPAAPVAEARRLRRVREQVVDGLAVLADAPPGGPLDQVLRVEEQEA